MALAGEGLAEGTWLRAGRQVCGRGRLGRSWESPEGNLHASTLVRLRPGDPPAPTLALVAAVAVHALVAPLLSRGARIKWPNDIMVGDAKLAGILLERAGDAVIVGIGINVTGAPATLDRPVTSLWREGAVAVAADAGGLTERLAELFAHWLSIWRGQGLEAVRGQWLANAHAPGTPMRASLPDGATVEGRFETMDRRGTLILRLANGDTHAIHAGDIFLI